MAGRIPASTSRPWGRWPASRRRVRRRTIRARSPRRRVPRHRAPPHRSPRVARRPRSRGRVRCLGGSPCDWARTGSLPMTSERNADAERGARDLLRHTVATLAYRGAKAVAGAPPEFASFRSSDSARTPVALLSHIGDLLDWAVSLAEGNQRWNAVEPAEWEEATTRFFAGLAAFDDYLASNRPLAWPAERLFQGPVADALTHVGQLMMMRRLAGCPVRSENYSKADVRAGRVTAEQTPPKMEF